VDQSQTKNEGYLIYMSRWTRWRLKKLIFVKVWILGSLRSLSQQELLKKRSSSFSASMSSTKLCPWTTLSVKEVLEVSVTVKRVDDVCLV
jgi:hypothetical protein